MQTKMDNANERKLINKRILEFYVCYNKFPNTEIWKYLCSDWTLNFKRVYELYEDNLKPGVTDYRYEEYLVCFRKLQPIFEGIHFLYFNAQLDLKKLNVDWLGGNGKYLLEFLESNEIAETLSVEKTLVLTSLLENALANLYFVSSGNCTPPHLLRDLLRTEELGSIFGLEIMSLLRIIMGSPNAINLRNIVWHGFPHPKEIPNYYTSILIIIIHSLGSVLKKNKIDKLSERPKATDLKILCDQVSNQLSLPSKSLKESEYFEQIRDNVLLPKDFKQYWYRLLQYYERQQHWNFVILIIPQIELLLRLIYAEANDLDVTAKLDEYYITMDSIFECNVITEDTNSENKLMNGDVLNEGMLKLTYDLFIAPNGPRMRDKISHGEVDIAAIDYTELCDILLHLSMGLLHFEQPFQKYESIFHLNCITKNALHTAIEEYEKLTEKHLMNRNAHDLSFISEKTAPTNIKIFNRPKKESEVNLLVLRNAKFVQMSCANYEYSIETKLKLLQQRELHSKRRRTLERLLETLPNICNVLREILTCLMCIFSKLQTDDSVLQKEGTSKTLLRFLKHTLKLTENIAKYSKESSNEWIKAVQLCTKFTEVKLQYYQKEYF
ncbi:endoplasmic reticulum membrane-associated RNA degradation protein [Zeugodacus cucurbitae]|uniref:endoplasmic reticulum membrane-associated RNA degradation protein n=1 Tax=Zeugodacus cucurbitae TaxID=28588 RepID=UPI0023D8FA27|nr:endoplasmic reticulum membrane-associated RNA degradation protein [Zeugodacus cucurbitae]XP_054087893.1 endoplasmic reticulum membrane-associated RNA degradation protein [Zeugodacus cucurbitae]XP_054087894.1 endoplasmic reticulum membrane-associated RNA degradation protein [Zeugodacus cucurbitae]XP_054087895.1 endoplasmic reticulum membrane-associated RNA degradation protein [Zeugodacus cucurbitae]